jgi:hypothetical protein
VSPSSVDGGNGAQATTGTAFDHVEAQLEELAAAFRLEAQAAAVRAVYRAIFRRSLGFAIGGRPAEPSRLNEDGTPIQFATAVGVRPAPLRMVGDPGPLDADGIPRMRAARAAIEEVAGIIGTEGELAGLRPLLAELAPPGDAALRDDRAGPFWIGAAFAPGVAARQRIYVNGGWGDRAARRARVRRFASHLGHSAGWEEIDKRLPASLEPLGMALTLSSGGPVRGAIYLRAFGLRLADYVALAKAAAGAANGAAIHAFGTALLGADAAYPTPSAVFSVGFGPERGLTAELEFCSHCLFRDDAEAQARSERLFAAAGVDDGSYRILARVLAAAASRGRPPRVHAFIGVGAKADGPAYTVYMKPDLSARSHDDRPAR